MGTKNGANASFLVHSKIFPKLNVQILQIRYQNVQEGSSFTVKREKKSEISVYHHVFISQKWIFFQFFKASIEFAILHNKSRKF